MNLFLGGVILDEAEEAALVSDSLRDLPPLADILLITFLWKFFIKWIYNIRGYYDRGKISQFRLLI